MASASPSPFSFSSHPPLSPKSATPKFPSNPFSVSFPSITSTSSSRRPISPLQVSSSPTNKPTTRTVDKTPSPPPPSGGKETVFFDGGAHYGDLLANILLGFTLLWMPLTIAAVFRAFFLRYRFTNLRVTVISGLTGGDRSDFPYKAIRDVQVVPRFIGEWGDVVITLKDGTKVDLRSVPKFREIADYCLYMADIAKKENDSGEGVDGPKGF
ncbi:pectinesterase inhibitor 10 [Nymphaea colorata]|uniref:YdbS-like PH domain-containing protein n=1 Tax=Nymphaea colorata TaxID=210225 RepID=A0A5K0VXB1_9MAGN|nr:pectinesterase inhibitor 10 [Nymphaea colorata]